MARHGRRPSLHLRGILFHDDVSTKTSATAGPKKRKPPMWKAGARLGRVQRGACFPGDDHGHLLVQQPLAATFQEKDAVDPNRILAAGRYGIWPKHLRG
jgi:hypothetical protein